MDLGLAVAIVLGAVSVWLVLLALLWLLRPKNVSLREFVRVIPDVVRLLRSVVSDRTAPLAVRLVIAGLFVWIVSPIDLIPEFIPVVGPFDDVIVAVLAMRYVHRRLGMEDLRMRWRGSADGFALLDRLIGSA